MGVPKYKGPSAKAKGKDSGDKPNPQEKAEAELFRQRIQEKLKDPKEAKKAAEILKILINS